MPKIIAECYFLDVGQGTCQVINLGDNSAIVIDCGPSNEVLIDLLQRRGIRRIAALILSHNHNDHVGGLTGLVRQYRKSIDCIFILQDMPAPKMEAKKHFRFLRKEYENGNVPEPIPLVRNSKCRWLYRANDSADSLRLELLFPNVFENNEGQASGDQNHTCGVLLLSCGKDRRVLFPGDAKIDAWRAIHKRRDKRPLHCDVMAMPHHGGQTIRRKKKNETDADFQAATAFDLEWLYTQAIDSSTAIVSVGTGNSYKHPIPHAIDAVRKSGSCVLCTQITNQCSEDLEILRPGVLSPTITPGQSQPDRAVISRSKSNGVACAGTVVVQIGPDEVHVERLDEHQNAIDTRLNSPVHHPLCRR